MLPAGGGLALDGNSLGLAVPQRIRVLNLARHVRGVRARLLAKRMVTWEGRWGSQAVKRYQRGVELYNVGGVSGVFLLLVFFLASASNMTFVAGVAVVLGLSFSGVLTFAGAFQFSRATRLISRRYGISPKARPPLTLKRCADPVLFDAWVVMHHGARGPER
jgi:hypothetical protein